MIATTLSASQDDDWLFLVPVSGVVLTSAVNNELKIVRATLVTRERLSMVRRRLGFRERISTYRNVPALRGLFEKSDVFAVIRQRGRPESIQASLQQLLRHELSILAASQLGYGSRKSIAALTPAGEAPIRITDTLLLSTQSSAFNSHGSVYGPFRSLVLDGKWLRFQKFSFFWNLLRILQEEVRIHPKWRMQLEIVASLTGQSQTTTDLNQALLWNIIALESLFASQGERTREVLIKRLGSLLDWSPLWSEADYASRIDVIYKKRSSFVHMGRSSDPINQEDVLFTDELLINALRNIVIHPNLFGSKQDLIRFSEKMDAASTLGLASQFRPKTLEAIHIASRT